jgi:hypothetical protein
MLDITFDIQQFVSCLIFGLILIYYQNFVGGCMNWPLLISGFNLIIYHSTKTWSILFFLGFIPKSYSDDVCANWSILVMEFILSLLPINPLIKLQCLWHKFESAMVCCEIAELGFGILSIQLIQTAFSYSLSYQASWIFLCLCALG